MWYHPAMAAPGALHLWGHRSQAVTRPTDSPKAADSSAVTASRTKASNMLPVILLRPPRAGAI